MRGGKMIAVLVMHRAEENHFVRELRVQRELLGNANAGNVRLNRAPRPAIFGRRVGLRIVRLHVTRPAVEPEEDHGFLAAPRRARGLEPQPVRRREAEQSEKARLDRRAPRAAAAI